MRIFENLGSVFEGKAFSRVQTIDIMLLISWSLQRLATHIAQPLLLDNIIVGHTFWVNDIMNFLKVQFALRHRIICSPCIFSLRLVTFLVLPSR